MDAILNSSDSLPALLLILYTKNVTQGDGLFFCAKSQPSQAFQTDSGVKSPSLSALALMRFSISVNLGSFKAKSYCDKTSATCRISYQIKGAFNFPEIRPHKKHVGMAFFTCLPTIEQAFHTGSGGRTVFIFRRRE